MKNHERINGKLLHTNKKFSQLKERQKAKISEWLYEYYKNYVDDNGREPKNDDVVFSVYQQIETAEIWLPLGELSRYYASRKAKIRKRYEKAKAGGVNEGKS